MFGGFHQPAPQWRVPAPPPGAPRRVPGSWLCPCPSCSGTAPLHDLDVLDAAELFRRHPLAHLELG